jgi:RAM signalling pathway protein
VESAVSSYSTVSHESSGSDTSFYRDDDHEPPKYPSPLYQSHIASNSMPSSPSDSPTVSLSPNNSASETYQYSSVTHHADTSSPSYEETLVHSQLHGRNASYSVARQPGFTDSQLVTKKSLPDLRGPDTGRRHMHRPQIPDLPGSKKPIIDSSNDDRHHKPPTPPENTPELSRHETSGGATTAPLIPTHSRTSRSQPGYNPSRNVTTAEALPSPAISPPQYPAPSMDVERNSYFRRLSTLPPSTISATIPESLLAMIDSARGILFAVSQIYQSLRHYTVFAIDDRLSGLLGKVLDPASTYMAHLINALDRFDSISRRGVPPPSVCRGVLESCRDNVAVFGKVVGVLHLQLKVLAGSDDARYSRSLLLMLYGSMAEISNSWQTMAPHLDAILPHLSDYRLPPPAISSSKMHTQTTPSTPMTTRNGISPIPEMQPLVSSPIPRTPSSANVPNGRSRMTRRHAGSFSTRDVQIGKTLPSTTEEAPLSSTSSPPVMQPLRSALRKPMTSSQVSLLYSQSSSLESPSGSTTHSRQSSSSPATPGGSQSTYQMGNLHQDTSRIVHSSLEVPSDSSKMVDEDLLATMEAATETARSVWRMMDEVLHTSQESSIELVESLQRGQDITKRLKEKIQAMRSGAVDEDRKAFWEDAHLFVKVCFLQQIAVCISD